MVGTVNAMKLQVFFKFSAIFCLVYCIFKLFWPLDLDLDLDLDPDPDSKARSGSTNMIESGSGPDPDPQHCILVYFKG